MTNSNTNGNAKDTALAICRAMLASTQFEELYVNLDLKNRNADRCLSRKKVLKYVLYGYNVGKRQ